MPDHLAAGIEGRGIGKFCRLRNIPYHKVCILARFQGADVFFEAKGLGRRILGWQAQRRFLGRDRHCNNGECDEYQSGSESQTLDFHDSMILLFSESQFPNCSWALVLILPSSQLAGTVRIGAVCPLTPLSVKENRIIRKKNMLFE